MPGKAIQRIAVLGAGTMGSRIAAHFANAGVPSLLLDLTVEAARKGLEAAAKQKPGGFFTDAAAGLVAVGSFDADLPQIAGCDWVVEAVTEKLEIKRAIWERAIAAAGPEAILSTNTSGIPLARIAEGWDASVRRRFLGTHFFNPPRYLHLIEIIPLPDTTPEILRTVREFADLRLGKGVVPCKDTPNFIGNRLGAFFGGTVAKITMEDGYTVEEVDALTGPLIGLPRSGSYRLLDIVGLDVWDFVGRNLYYLVPDDPWRERFRTPPFLEEMLRRGWLGEKSGQGFYRRAGKGAERVIEAIDLNTFDYHPAKKAEFASTEALRRIPDLHERLRQLAALTDRAGSFLWKLFADYILYAAERVPEISDRIVEIDRAMRWGYGHTLGPFELWDALGFEATARRMESEGRKLPESAARMLEAGSKSFYRSADEKREPKTQYFDLPGTRYADVEPRPGVVVLKDRKRAGNVMETNPGATLVDLGDGVFCVEFHSKANTIGDDNIAMIHRGIERATSEGQALVIANEGERFSAGANLMLVLLAAQNEEWDELQAAIGRFQGACMAIKYAPVPVVVAPFGQTLGGGCEIALHGARVQASAELYIGLVEVGVGLIPAAGGCKEMLLRWGDPKTGSAQRAFETIGFAKVSTSAANARELGFLTPADGVSMNPERLIGDAKARALSLAAGYARPAPAQVTVGGDAAYAAMKAGAWMAHQGGFITDYDLVIGEKLAYVLSGGRVTGKQQVSEQRVLDLELEAFMSLCGDPRTQARMQHMLKTGKPLRN